MRAIVFYLLLCASDHQRVIVDRVDTLEINAYPVHVSAPWGGMFSHWALDYQLIGWDWVSHRHQYVQRFCIPFSGFPTRDGRGWKVRWHDGPRIREAHSKTLSWSGTSFNPASTYAQSQRLARSRHRNKPARFNKFYQR